MRVYPAYTTVHLEGKPASSEPITSPSLLAIYKVQRRGCVRETAEQRQRKKALSAFRHTPMALTLR